MSKQILLGDEAIALGAIHAGISSSYAYPGTPSTEIHEYIRKMAPKFGLKTPQWSTNEKVAYEEAMGCSHAGKRCLVGMKHVGLNVAADPFMNSALTGVNGGVVVCVADDPSMHSSQNEQDTRYFAQFAQIPCFEPGTQQAAYDMTMAAFELSEKFGLPIVMRIVTRLAHSRAGVETSNQKEQNKLSIATNNADWTLLPVNARRRYKQLVSMQAELQQWSEQSSFNKLTLRGEKGGLGIIASGIAYNYVMENYTDQEQLPSMLHVQAYPYPKALIKQLCDHCSEIIIFEDGYPFIERSITGLVGIPDTIIKGRLSGELPATGELTPTLVREALGMEVREASSVVASEDLPNRPPALCPGCPHIDTYNALNEAMSKVKGSVYSDIGCYTLGALPPYNAIGSCLCMGASVSMAKGAADAGVFPAVSVIGDSTFAHSGITPLLSAVQENSPITVIIVDNSTVAMTGGQETAATDEQLVKLIEGIGVSPEHIKVINPLKKHHDDNVKIMLDELNYQGLSVVIPKRDCVQTKPKKPKADN